VNLQNLSCEPGTGDLQAPVNPETGVYLSLLVLDAGYCQKIDGAGCPAGLPRAGSPENGRGGRRGSDHESARSQGARAPRHDRLDLPSQRPPGVVCPPTPKAMRLTHVSPQSTLSPSAASRCISPQRPPTPSAMPLLLRCVSVQIDYEHMSERFHQGIGGQLIRNVGPTNDNGADGKVACRSRLGRLLNYYHREAA
jgi:hypothetical protein